ETVLNYESLEKRGGGGMGVVYKARDTRLGRTVALKFLSAHLLSDREARARFVVEAQAAASLDHPNLCTIHEIGEADDGRMHIAMAYYEGETLQRRIGRGQIGVADALGITAQISRGLARAAEQGIIHRDIKPGNVMLTVDGTVKIVDFGLAKMMGGDLTRTGARMGTVSYMSPEQTRGDTVDQRTDVWSIGVVLYEMLSGKRPFRGGSDQAIIHSILHDTPVPLDEAVPGLPPSVTALVERAMHKDPVRRYPDAASLLKDVERLIADPESRSPMDSTPSLPPEGERRLITVLAFAISGFERLLDTLEPEAVDEELAQLRARVQGVVEDYGGVLNEFSEDQMIALFGVPVTHEDDALRAVRAALEITKAHGVDRGIELRCAVGSGNVAIQATEAGERRYRVGGTVGRDVARLAAAAASGEILVSAELSRTVVPFVDTEERAPVTLSSDGPPVTPLAVLGESEADSRLDASMPGRLTRFVGRKDELSTLMRALEGANSGAGRVVSVLGDAGVGKSRLLHEFRSSLADDSIRYVQGRCHANGSLTPFLPFIECVKAMLGTARSQEEQAHDHVVERTRSLASELEIYIPVLLHLLSIESDEYRLPDYLAGEDLRATVAEALVSLFTLGSRGQPLVMLLEDWHWSDGGSSDVLDQLAEMVSAYPLLVVVTARPELDAQRPSPRGQIHLDLAPLDPTSAVEVMRASLGGARVPVELAERIGEKTGGNPFFIEELCRTLLETGALVISEGEAQLASGIERLVIPDTVEAVLKSRLDRLDPEAREVLRCAAVIGPQFGLKLLKKVVPSRSRLEGSLGTLRDAGLIQRTGLGKEPSYRFKHALTLDVTYESLLERQRKERHAVVGAAIEELYGDNTEEYSARLAVHFAVAEDWDKAIRYGLAAAQRAESLWRLPETVETLIRTRGWIEQSGKEPVERTSLLIKLLFDLERHLEKLGRRDEQQQVIDDLSGFLAADVHTKERGEVCVRQGDLHTLSGRFKDARPPLNQALEIADQLDDPELRGKVLRSLGHLLWRQGDYGEAVPWLEKAVNNTREQDDNSRLIRDILNLGRALRRLEEWDRAMAIGEEALVLANETGNPVDQSYAYNYKGHLLRAMGRTDDAIDAFEEGGRLAREARVPAREVFNTLGAAALYLEKGQLDKGLATYQDSVQLARRANRTDQLAQSLVFLGEALVTCGKPEQASPHFEEAVSVLRRIGDEEPLASALAELANAQQRAALPEAEATWRQAIEMQERLGDRSGAMAALERLAGLRRAPDRSEAHWLYRRALAIATELEDKETEARIRNSIALSAWQGGELDEAEKQYRKAAALIRCEQNKDELGVVLNGLGAVLTQQDQASEALTVLQEALAANREFRQDVAEADSLAALGAAARAAGDLSDAGTWYQQCIERRRDLGDRAGEGWALQRLSEVSREAGESQQADAFAAAALAVGREIGDKSLQSLASEVQSPE
ncbi:MAG: tetratricopeptide repeat protein, partial [Planctomycetes bacterium]|nr:tetratricopeptide repeat protein [Planctomycetota bacterium]